MKETTVPKGNESTKSVVASLSDFLIIGEENLFHPERKIPPEKKVEQPLPKPEFVLYGTLITDSERIAYLEDQKAPRNSPSRGKRQTILKEGDSMSGFILKKVDAEKIVMVRGEEKLIVNISDKHKTKAGASVTPSATAKPSQSPISEIQKALLKNKPAQVQGEVLPPKNAEEQSIINFFQKTKK